MIVLAVLPVANLKVIGWSPFGPPWPEVTSGGANQNSVPVWLKVRRGKKKIKRGNSDSIVFFIKLSLITAVRYVLL